MFNALRRDNHVEGLIGERQFRYVARNRFPGAFFLGFPEKTDADIDAHYIGTSSQRPAAEKTRTTACVEKPAAREILSAEQLIKDHFQTSLQVVVIHDLVEIRRD
jgi:hypothetical protein